MHNYVCTSCCLALDVVVPEYLAWLVFLPKKVCHGSTSLCLIILDVHPSKNRYGIKHFLEKMLSSEWHYCIVEFPP
jgi:hypothetical protein